MAFVDRMKAISPGFYKGRGRMLRRTAAGGGGGGEWPPEQPPVGGGGLSPEQLSRGEGRGGLQKQLQGYTFFCPPFFFCSLGQVEERERERQERKKDKEKGRGRKVLAHTR